MNDDVSDGAPSLSVIIPTLNEAASIGELIATVRRQDSTCEILVVDGGSNDGTPDIIPQAGARLLSSAPGRGQQLATGAAHAAGNVLFFLHADTKLPDGALAALIAACRDRPDAVGGNFRLLFDGGTAFDDWLNSFYARIRARGRYYGDSGIFIRREVYRRLGGIRPIALMEDYDFVRRMEKAGPTLCIEDPPLLTSSRKFEGRRPAAIVTGWVWIHALWHLGVSPDLLARIYYGKRKKG